MNLAITVSANEIGGKVEWLGLTGEISAVFGRTDDVHMKPHSGGDCFFPVGSTGQALLQLSKAKETCNQCTVKIECLQFAIDTNQDSGVWGGTSEEERRAMRRQMAARNRAASAG